MNLTIFDSFYVTYAFLVTTGTITFIESLRTNIVPMRHILNLETCISIVAAFFYGKFINTLNENKDNLNDEKLQNEINDNRYIDWMITTPIMLLVLMLAFQYNSGKSGLYFIDFLCVLVFNYAMLGSGYLGEKNVITKPVANIIGFIFFFILYSFLYVKYLKNTKGGNNKQNQILYSAFFILWSLYGVFYLMKENIKNAGYNILDLFSKCFIGIYFWCYSSNIFKG